MSKNILIISTIPRRGSNSETLADEFARGAADSGNNIEKINTQTLWMSNGQCIPIPKGKYRLLSKAFIAHHFKEAM